ncbi:MAG: hypothetical protein ACPG4U_05640 [Pseudomonadales bacterium]
MLRNTLLAAFFYAIASNSISAPLTNLSTHQLEQVFARADKLGNLQFLYSTSQSPLRSLQLLPETKTPKTNLPIAAQCIKLYNCNQGVCLIDYRGNKHAISEQLLKENSAIQKRTDYCNKPVSVAKSQAPVTQTPTPKIVNQKSNQAFYRVVNVASDDRLNIRAQKHYKSKKLGSLASNASCIVMKQCIKNWCLIEHNETKGWSNNRYLSQMDNTDSCTANQ